MIHRNNRRFIKKIIKIVPRFERLNLWAFFQKKGCRWHGPLVRSE